jgi:hypothetical protein
MMAADMKWLLIEFKRDAAALNSEVSKFDGYLAAKQKLSAQDRHHFLVYGDPSKQGELELKACTYFSRMAKTPWTQLLGAGAEIKEFSDYVQTLLDFKKTIKVSSGAGGRSASLDYAMVAGVSPTSQLVSCRRLGEFGLDMGLNLTREPQNVYSRGRGLSR